MTGSHISTYPNLWDGRQLPSAWVRVGDYLFAACSCVLHDDRSEPEGFCRLAGQFFPIRS